MIFDYINSSRRLRLFKMCPNERKTLVVFICTFLVVIVYIPFKRCFPPQYSEQQQYLIEKFTRLNLSFNTFTNLVAGENNRVYQFNRSSPFIFISSFDGYSGGSFLRRLLNAHRDIECGHEVNAISHLLMMRQKTLSTQKERTRLELAGVGPPVFEPAVAAFIIEIFTRQLQPVEYLCNEDYYSVKDAYFLVHLFPRSRYVLVIRDGRAVAHSKMPSNHTSADFNSTLFEEHLNTWNKHMYDMIRGCRSVGRYCLAVYYEHLLLHPIYGMKMILTFLGVPFPRYDDEESFVFFDKMGAALLQGNDPNTKNKLIRWAECAPKDAFVLRNTTDLLATLGYLDLGNPPDYQKLSQRNLLRDLFY